MSVHDKRGFFYLGRQSDDGGKGRIAPVLYNSQDLLTHAVILGMTGCGKTGLGITLIEEAAMESVPSLVVDLKGDLTNLLLTFPDMTAREFQPWVSKHDAQVKLLSHDQYAAEQARQWAEGLTESEQDGDRIRRMRSRADFEVFTPGNELGTRFSIASSLHPQWGIDASDLADRAEAVCETLLGLLGVPTNSKEAGLVTTVLQHCWQAGMKLDIASLIRMVESPPMSRVGLMPLDSAYSRNFRYKTASRLNSLAAQPGLLELFYGDAISIEQLLHGESGRPRVAVLSVAHLSDAARSLFLSLFFQEIVTWTSRQVGRQSLSALLFVDEASGLMPPVANPPTKKPLLTLIKRGRAVGLGVVIATDNTMDLDYKGMGNAGTWFCGRLRTDRDAQRITEVVPGWNSRQQTDPASIRRTLCRLKDREFLVHNVHRQSPTRLATRTTMSYLAGPLDREQMKQLKKRSPAAQVSQSAQECASENVPGRRDLAKPEGYKKAEFQRPIVDKTIEERFLPCCRKRVGQLVYTPLIAAEVEFHVGRKHVGSKVLMFSVAENGIVEWPNMTIANDAKPLGNSPEGEALFHQPIESLTRADSYAKWKTEVLVQVKMQCWSAPSFSLFSKPNESRSAFEPCVQEKAANAEKVVMKNLQKKYHERLSLLKGELTKTIVGAPPASEQTAVANTNYKQRRDELKRAFQLKATQMREKIAIARSQIQRVEAEVQKVRLALGWAPHEQQDGKGSLRPLYLDTR